MLMKIDRVDVALGMFVHGFEGGWLSHPFWRTQFLLTRPDDVARIRQSGVTGVIVDARKGAAPQPARPDVAIVPEPAPPAATGRRLRTAASVRAQLAALPATAEGRATAARRQTRLLVAKSAGVARELFDDVRLGRAIRCADVVNIVDDIAESVESHRSMIVELTRLRDKDHYTYFHSVAVCALMVNVARELGMDDRRSRTLGLAGMLHDIGKSTIDQNLLMKTGPLTAAETAEMRQHVPRGHALLSMVEGLPDEVFDVCLNHHERIDGSGYPHGLSGSQLSVAARLAAICDVYDALTSERVYKEIWPPSAAIDEMYGQPAQYDRTLLFAFMKSIGVFPADMVVRMRSNQLAIVLADPRQKAPTRVRVFWSIADHALVEPYDLTPSQDLAGDQIVSREQPLAWGLTDWEAMRADVLRPPAFGRRRRIRG